MLVQELAVDDLDLRLIHALQIRARIPWTALAQVLEVDAITLTRRWRRLQERGLVYVTAMPRHFAVQTSLAFVEITCSPPNMGAVGAMLVNDPAVVSVDTPTSGTSFLVTLSGTSNDAVPRWVFALNENERITQVNTHLVTELVGDASQWRPRVLSAEQITAIQSFDRPVRKPVTLSPSEIRELYEVLSDDMRAPIGQIAAQLGIPVRRLSDSFAGLLAANEILFRIDVARPATPTPVYVWYLTRLAAKDLTASAQALRQLPNMRSVVKTVGKYNLQAAFWFHNFSEIHQMEELLETNLPNAVTLDSHVITRSLKHIGHELNESGLAVRRIRSVPHA